MAQSASATASGTVTGQVIAQDTQLPARFAQVLLQDVGSVSSNDDNNAFHLNAFRGSFAGTALTTTGADGTFTALNVAPGDYYVTATAPGYIPERSLLAAELAAGADPADLLAHIPVVHVSAESVSSVTVTMERGGTLAGRVLWEDGSPASGIRVSAVLNGAATTLPASLQQIGSAGFSDSNTSDDRGAFRITGLASGDYLVQAVIENRPQFGGRRQGSQATSAIHVYSPGVFRKTDAKPISIRAGDERDELRMVIDLRTLHTVSGHVTSTAAGLSVASGVVLLTDPGDSTLRLNGSIDSHGDFAVQYVPPGNYTLGVAAASTQSLPSYRGRDSQTSAAVFFQPFSEPVSVTDTDLTGVTASLTPMQTAP
jgi:hypothetical protein